MNNCIKKLYNGDISASERICLIIDNSILLTEHHNTFNFPGGKINSEYLYKYVGTNSLRELKEELGLIIKKEHRKPRLISYYFDNKNCIRILVAIKILQSDIIFKKATHIWESRKFTLIPLDNNIKHVNKLGKYLETEIRKYNSPCAQYIKISTDGDIKSIVNKERSEYIYKENNNYFIKLTPDVNLKSHELEYLKEINKIVTGYADTEYIYKQDYICKYSYYSLNKNLKFTISKQFLDRIKDLLKRDIKPSFKLKSYNSLIIDLYNNKLDNLETDSKKSYYRDIITLYTKIYYT